MKLTVIKYLLIIALTHIQVGYFAQLELEQIPFTNTAIKNLHIVKLELIKIELIGNVRDSTILSVFEFDTSGYEIRKIKLSKDSKEYSRISIIRNADHSIAEICSIELEDTVGCISCRSMLSDTSAAYICTGNAGSILMGKDDKGRVIDISVTQDDSEGKIEYVFGHRLREIIDYFPRSNHKLQYNLQGNLIREIVDQDNSRYWAIHSKELIWEYEYVEGHLIKKRLTTEFGIASQCEKYEFDSDEIMTVYESPGLVLNYHVDHITKVIKVDVESKEYPTTNVGNDQFIFRWISD